MENSDGIFLAVICGEEENDGETRIFGEDGEYSRHIEALRDYLYTYYDDLAKQIDADKVNHNEELIAYLTTLKNIVYLYSPGYGLLFLPKEVTEKQVESLYKLVGLVSRVPIHIDYCLLRKNGEVLPLDVFDGDMGLENKEVLDQFFESKPYVKKVVNDGKRHK